MPSRTHNFRNSEELAQVSRRTKQVPLEALLMLTQSVSKCNQEYMHPLPFKDEEQKKSPLALLAATCSSIGKSEPTRPKSADSGNQNKTQPGKISSEDTRSSFKPYKQAAEKEMDDQMNEKVGFRAPSKENTSSGSPVSVVKEERAKVAPSFQHSSEDTHCSHACGGVLLEGSHQAPHAPTRLHNDCSGPCNHATSLLPFKSATPSYPAAVLPGEAFKTHGVSTPLASSMYGQCGCGFCAASAQHGDHPQGALTMNNLASRPLQLHGPGPTPYVDYLHRTVCRDANCSNCLKAQAGAISPYGLPAAAPPHQYGAHCLQCDNAKSEQSPSTGAYSCYYPHTNVAMFKGSQDETQPFVCNWVSGTNHCGKSFATSEDLFQHLRTHTQAGNAAVSSPSLAQPSCNIHGCPCKLRASPVHPTYHSPRYRPYYMKPSSFLPPPGVCYTASPFQYHGVASSYDSHRLFK